MKISDHVTLKEVIHSNTAIANGIDNTPTKEELVLIKALCVNVFDPLRKHTNAPIKINSVYRGPKLNAHPDINGSKTSQHCVGLDPTKNSYGAALDLDDYYWVKDISEATIYEEKDRDQQGVSTYAYVINGLKRYDGFPDAKLVEVEHFYKEK